ncbi:MAG: type II secretion system major pseudopilin GspG [Nitrospirota bacterium]|nr:type II secretion system major pseudopilin GspG [Nitrospirota bacterium]
MKSELPKSRRTAPPVVPGEGGFTLIEIMVVITILAMLAALVGPKLLGQTDKARVADAQIQIRNIAQGLDLYKLDNAVYPTTEQGLEALVSKPAIGVIPHNYKEGGYMSMIPKDPWGNNYVYLSPGTSGPYDLLSWGADGTEGGAGYDADVTAKNLN